MPRRNTGRALALLGLAWLVAPLSWGQTYEQRLAACVACHGPQGNSQMANVPSLAGQPRLFIENQLVLIREGVRDIPAMKGLLDGVSDDDVGRVARHFASQPLNPQPAPRQAALHERGQKLVQETRCGICHLPTYLGREQMPRLAGQREDYLLHAMRMMQTNQAVGRDPIMSASIYGIADADLQAMAHYLSQIKP